MLDPGEIPRREVRALRTFVAQGGRLVAGGGPSEWMDGLVPEAPTWSATGSLVAEPIAPAAEVGGIDSVRARGSGSWSDPGGTLPVLGDEDGALVTVAAVGRGRAVLFADASALHNDRLDTADNAALGLAVAGERGRPVLFVESVHGYSPATGLAAVPVRWRWTLAGLTVAAVAAMVARGRRLGPPEQAARDLPPPRRNYVESVAGILARSNAPRESVEPLRAAVRIKLLERSRLSSESGPGELRKAAVAAGLTEGQVRAVVDPSPGEGDVMALGRAAARLEQGRDAR
jgi:hypothetical protein